MSQSPAELRRNYDRAAGTLDAFSKGNFPPTPEVALTPRSGRTLVHRVGLHLEGGLDPAAPANRTPRAKGEPAKEKAEIAKDNGSAS